MYRPAAGSGGRPEHSAEDRPEAGSVRSLRVFVSCFVLVSFLSPLLRPARALAQGALSVPVGSPIYDDLEHFRALGLWHGSLETRPLTREEVAHIVRAMAATPRAQRLSGRDEERFARLADTIAELLGKDRTHGPAPAPAPSSPGCIAPAEPGQERAPNREGASCADSSGRWLFPPVRWELGASVQATGDYATIDSLADLKRRPRRNQMFLFHLNAAFGSRLTVESRFYEDYSRLTPLPGRRHWVDNFPPSAEGLLTDPSARNDRAIIGYSSPWLHLRYGREDRHWGAGRRGTLFLSENPFPLDGLSLRIGTRHISGVSLLAQTGRERTSASSGAAPGTPAEEDAYMAAQRIEFHPPWPFRIGFYEAVVYAGRGLDLAYANPIGQLVAITQDVFDRFGVDDKKIAGGDLEVDLAPVTVYGEVLLDRLMSMKNATAGEASEISSWAQLAGLRYADPLGWSGADLDLEYAHLDPQVYFHKDRDRARAFLSGGELIGHWAGPNADDFFASVTVPPSGRFGSLRFWWEQVRWGLIDGERGTAAGFVGLLKKDKHWITGQKQCERIAAVEWERFGWRTFLPGSFDTDLMCARVMRTGPAEAGSGLAWAQSGWQVEAHLTWNFRTTLHEAGERAAARP
jgi:hypothetical protein